MLKVYAGLLAFLALGVVFLVYLVRKRDLYYLKIIIPAVFIAAITYMPLNFGYGRLILAPGLLYRHYLESVSDIYKLTWYNRLLVYEAHKNYIKIFLYQYALVLPLFFLPSLGIRLVSLVYIKRLFTKSFYSDQNIFWIALVFFGFLIPSLFIQSVSVFVVLQFLWITYFILLIPTSFSFSFIFEKIGKHKSLIIVAILILLSIPDNLRLIKIYSTNPLRVDLGLYNVTHKISQLPKEAEIISLNTTKTGQEYNFQSNIPIISALSLHSVYLEPEVTEFANTKNEIESRKKVVGDLNELLIYCQDSDEITRKFNKVAMQTKDLYILDLNKTTCFDKLKDVELIFRDSGYSLYKIL